MKYFPIIANLLSADNLHKQSDPDKKLGLL